MMAVGDHGRENNAFEYGGSPQYNQTSTPQSNTNELSLPGANQPAITRSMLPPSECGYQTSYTVPELFDFGSDGYTELFLIACFGGPPISGYILAKRMLESYPCYKYIWPFVFMLFLMVGIIVAETFFILGSLEYEIVFGILASLLFVVFCLSIFITVNLTRQRRSFVEKAIDFNENCCQSFWITSCCTCCSHGQIGAYTKIHQV